MKLEVIMRFVIWVIMIIVVVCNNWIKILNIEIIVSDVRFFFSEWYKLLRFEIICIVVRCFNIWLENIYGVILW